MTKFNYLILCCLPFAFLSAHSSEIETKKEIVGKQTIIEALIPNVITRGIRIANPVLEIKDHLQSNVATIPSPSISLTVNFEYNSHTLTNQAKQQLDQLGQALSSPELQGLTFMLEGHTDAIGSESYNQALSQRRSETAGAFLRARHGIAPEALLPVGRGESKLKDEENPTSGVNRRVVISTLSQPG